MLRGDEEFARFGTRDAAPADPPPALDFLLLTPGEPHRPEEVFDRLRWGGQVFAISGDEAEVERAAALYAAAPEFVLERARAFIHTGPFGWAVPGLRRRVHYAAFRKVLIVRPGQNTDRFTYDVRLVRRDGDSHYLVQKQIPTFEQVVARLTDRFRDTSPETIARGARKLVEKIFPVFLTREAAFLNILQRDLPPRYKSRVPRVVELEKDDRGLVRRLYLNWLRNGGEPISQLDFARQGLDLLRALHDEIGIIHLDLRLDNVVVTEHGVGFVDFGSAVRVGEDLSQNPMLATLFREMMSTSEIQQLLGRMKHSGKVTSPVITEAHHKVDKAIDLFHLSVQMNYPHRNPDFAGLVRYERDGQEARALAKLTREVLRPKDLSSPPYRCVSDVLSGIRRLERKLAAGGAPTTIRT